MDLKRLGTYGLVVLAFVVPMLIATHVLNLVWFRSIASMLVRVITKGGSSQKKKTETETGAEIEMTSTEAKKTD